MNPTPKIPAIAIIDDDPLYRKVIAHLLEKNNVKILFEAASGAESIGLMEQANLLPDIVILDVEMPQMDGFETARMLKKHWPQIKIIANSGSLDPSVSNKMIAAGADRFIAKDFNGIKIAELIQEVYEP
ncbi:response regulator [Mucilaginibacter polytrichastri]|nr:response regulator transcription factor [Mucilaginibacter polytrichastri]SFT23803.1 Response regulator receiver domain-containing protein [Mucilaginibacter polytrichastri]